MPRRLLLQMHMSLDGFIAGQDNQLVEWITYNFSPDLNKHIMDISASVDEIILGRKLAEGFIPAWASRPSHEPGVEQMNQTSKIVFSTSINDNPWGDNVRLIREDFEGEIRSMKAADGGDIMVYGGVQTVQFLAEQGLVDELFLLISPVAIGDGARLFKKRSDWEVAGIHRFECGVVVLHYRLKA